MTKQAPDKVLDRIKKLMNLAAKNPNEHEAASALAKAQGLMEEWNLTAGEVDRKAADSGRRAEELVEGGFYRYQQELWEAIAELNFCMYWSQQYVRKSKRDRFGRIARVGRRHRLLGSRLNVATTVAMAQYLEGAIERIARERFPGRRLDNYVMSFRQGMAYRLREKLEDRRRDNLTREGKAAEEAARRKGVSTSTALTLAGVAEQEKAANYDHEYGEGAWAKRQARRAQAAEERRIREEAHTRWAAEHPEEAKREEAKRRKAMDRLQRSAERARYGKVDEVAFWRGAEAGEAIGIDPQATQKLTAGRLK